MAAFVDVTGSPTTNGNVEAAAVPADLRTVTASRDADWRVPAGWEPVADIARTVLRDVDPLVERITDAIVAEIAAYGNGLVPRDDLRASVLRNLEALLVGLAERRPPTAKERDVRRELGTQRALQGIRVDAVIKAYHVGYRELWLAVVAALPPGDDDATTKLLSAATIVWQWVHEVTDAIASAHAATTRTLEARAVGARQRFMELLVAGDVGGQEARRLVRSLELDPTGDFQVAVVRGVTDDLDAVHLQHTLESADGRHEVALRGPLVVTVSQGGDIEVVVDAIRHAVPTGAVAIGARRSCLAGARASLEDAEQALQITADGPPGSTRCGCGPRWPVRTSACSRCSPQGAAWRTTIPTWSRPSVRSPPPVSASAPRHGDWACTPTRCPIGWIAGTNSPTGTHGPSRA